MWDIKEQLQGLQEADERFHLNHVGYKGRTSPVHCDRCIRFHLNHVGYKVNQLTIRE
ncbi:hypothetical protein A45J_1851 [hot springs metagenome]|uniref:Uncharacterized protein n=1 Tax=hot springs metagenome TaxID=433727 RepID=A0A5J4L342_9ZZZZ